MRCLIVVYTASLLVLSASFAKAIDAEWLAPVDGDWSDGSLWSTDPLAPVGAGDTALINAIGSPYTTAVSQNTFVNTVTIDSPDATLLIDKVEFSASGGIQIDQGKLLLRGGVLSNTRVSGAGSFGVSYGNGPPILDSVELATDVSGSSLVLRGANVLDNATVDFRSGRLESGGSLTGSGSWRLGTFGTPGSSPLYNSALVGGGEFTLGAGVELRPGNWKIRFNSIDGTTFVNQGIIRTVATGEYLSFDRIRNEGTINVANGTRVAMTTYDNVGQVNINSGGNLWLSGNPYFNVPLVVGNGAELYVTDSGNPQSGQPIQLQSGGEITVSKLNSVPKINANGGQVVLNSTYTPTQIGQLPITGNTTLRGNIDLDGTTLEYTSLPQTLNTVGSNISNGVLTGPNTPLEFAGSLVNLTLDVPGIASAGVTGVYGVSTIAKPFQISGGQLNLRDTWVNTGGISVSSGLLGIDTLPTDPADTGTIVFTGGELRIGHDLTLAELQGYPIALPDRVTISRANFYANKPTLDLETGTLVLSTLPYQLTIGAGNITNGTVLGDARFPTIEFAWNASASGVTFESVTLEKTNGSVPLTNSTLRNSVVLGNSSYPLYLRDSDVEDTVFHTDVELRGQNTALGHLEINGILSGQRGSVLSLAAGTTLGGTGIIGNTTGRVQGQTLQIVDPQFTIPASLTLVSATQYDSTDIVSASNTALRIEADIMVGFETPFPGNTRSDSWTFNVASLETLGAIDVNLDGTLTVAGGLWKHSGILTLDDGLVVAEGVTVEPSGSIVGDGTVQASEGLLVEGSIESGASHGVLTVNGDLTLVSSSTLEINLIDAESGVANNELDVTGFALLGGTLQVTANSALNVGVGDFFPVLTTLNGIFFEFDDVDLPALDGSKAFRLIYGETLVGLEVVSNADFDNDVDVDGADFLAIQRNNPSLISAWQTEFGSGVPTLASSQAVPEPASWLLILVAAQGCMFLRINRT